MLQKSRLLLSLLPLLAAWPQAQAAAAPEALDPALTLERIHGDPPLMGRAGLGGVLSPGGQWLTYLRPSEANPDVNELWGTPVAGGDARRLVAASDLIGQREAVLTEAERMALERRRQRGAGITGYQWCGKDDRQLILPLSGDLYSVELAHSQDGAPKVRRLTHDEQEPERDPQCDAAGRQLAYVKQNDLWIQGLDGSPARRLTHTGSETRSTGLAEFIAEEELHRHRGFWWSPDGTRLLALEVDESGVPLRRRAQIGGDGTRLVEQRYPAAGSPNAKVQALVLDLSGKAEAQRLPLPAEAEYIARAGWFADGSPWLQWLTRDQKRLQLLEFNAQAQPHVVLDERDAAWVEVHDDLRELPGLKRSGKPALLWSSERSGRRQLYLVDRVSGAVQALTHQPEPVAQLVCLGEQHLVFAGATERGRGRELFQADFKGQVRQLQPGEARRWRDARGDAACTRLLITQSSWQQAPRTELLLLDGRTAPRLIEQARPDPLVLDLAAKLQPQFPALLAADGKTPLNAIFLPPTRPSLSGNYPVVVRAYGGPGTATVNWRWQGDLPTLALYQQQGFGVLMLDTRGMAFRDRDFTRAHDHAFGKTEVADLFGAVRQLVQQYPAVDAGRIGFMGWSYGGFLALRALLDADTPIAAAIAGASPTDWTLYDTAYTERYLGLPEGGKAPAYQQAQLVSRAALLSKPLMIIHGTADDNVLFDNSLRMIQALQNEGKLFETVIYPGHAHGVAGRKARYHLARTQLDFFQRQLRP